MVQEINLILKFYHEKEIKGFSIDKKEGKLINQICNLIVREESIAKNSNHNIGFSGNISSAFIFCMGWVNGDGCR